MRAPRHPAVTSGLRTRARARGRVASALLALALAGVGTAGAALAGDGAAAAGPAMPMMPAASAGGHHATARVCGTPQPGHAHCDAVVQTDSSGVAPNAAGATPAGYGPADIQSAYALAGANAAGRTVAIVDAYDLPTADSDLAAYRSTYNLPACTAASGCFRKVGQAGTATLPAADSGWGQEIALDLDMVSAACPSCKILLVEANSSSLADLGGSVNTAVRLGAIAVSNSYGGSESSGETFSESTYYNHPGIAITVSSGDSGYGVEFPAASRYVTSVGGTSLTRAAGTTRGWTEAAWSGAGSGCSAYVTKPAFQTDASCPRRTVADVSAVADPQTGVAVYDTTANSGQSGWLVFGGTSAASPIVAGVYALAGTPAGGTQANGYPYAHPSSLNDVTSGSNGSCGGSYLCTGKSGYDGPTGLGTPNGTAAFSSSTGGGGTPTPAPTPTPSCTAAQLLGNGGFETGTAAPWTASSGVVTNSTGEAAHAGAWKAWLDGYGSAHTDTLAQSVSIPAGCRTAALSYFLHIDTRESGSTAYDKLSVQVLNSAGSVLTTLATYSNANATTGFTQRTASLAAYAGQTVTLRLTGTEDSSLATSFVVDDASLAVN